ncbi:MAG: GPW/gp25 family protein [Acidimicrobiia bacterium]|nr:GPW/gp25 family protein [Acidimicrobiia bacterium]
MLDDYIGAGWAFPLRVNTRGGIALVTRERELEEAMRLILATYPGERPMRPQFGSRARDWVFRGTNADSLVGLQVEVQNALTRWEPRVEIERVLAEPDTQDRSLVRIHVLYRPKDTNDRRNLTFPFYTIPDDGSDY